MSRVVGGLCGLWGESWCICGVDVVDVVGIVLVIVGEYQG